jgi:hypothetical protein
MLIFLYYRVVRMKLIYSILEDRNQAYETDNSFASHSTNCLICFRSRTFQGLASPTITFVASIARAINVTSASSALGVSVARIDISLTDVNGEYERVTVGPVIVPATSATHDPKSANRLRSELATCARVVAHIGLAEFSVRRLQVRLVC